MSDFLAAVAEQFDREPDDRGRAGAMSKLSDTQVREASARIAAGELQGDVARALGITKRGLYARLVALDLPRGKRGAPKRARLNHCRTCRCTEGR